eukprot:TRINITY_DN2142_c0_g1_i1.p1 TRINITY_DN2142_c0_g1~~TRINITY_DN2142_c0_g1_i1.p1  ORF type:complete len:127 (+),score=13.56 TRINITY_DN2142_c0_g1_i1:90-470(+)
MRRVSRLLLQLRATPVLPMSWLARIVTWSLFSVSSAWPGVYEWATKEHYSCIDRVWVNGVGAQNVNISKALCEDDNTCQGFSDFTPNGGGIALCKNGSKYKVFMNIRTYFKADPSMYSDGTKHWLS